MRIALLSAADGAAHVYGMFLWETLLQRSFVWIVSLLLAKMYSVCFSFTFHGAFKNLPACKIK